MAETRAQIIPIMAYPMTIVGVPMEVFVLSIVSGVSAALLTAIILLALGQGLQLTPVTLVGAGVLGAVFAWFYRAMLIDPFFLMRLKEHLIVRPRAIDPRSRLQARGKHFVPTA